MRWNWYEVQHSSASANSSISKAILKRERENPLWTSKCCALTQQALVLRLRGFWLLPFFLELVCTHAIPQVGCRVSREDKNLENTGKHTSSCVPSAELIMPRAGRVWRGMGNLGEYLNLCSSDESAGWLSCSLSLSLRERTASLWSELPFPASPSLYSISTGIHSRQKPQLSRSIVLELAGMQHQ